MRNRKSRSAIRAPAARASKTEATRVQEPGAVACYQPRLALEVARTKAARLGHLPRAKCFDAGRLEPTLRWHLAHARRVAVASRRHLRALAGIVQKELIVTRDDARAERGGPARLQAHALLARYFRDGLPGGYLGDELRRNRERAVVRREAMDLERTAARGGPPRERQVDAQWCAAAARPGERERAMIEARVRVELGDVQRFGEAQAIEYDFAAGYLRGNRVRASVARANAAGRQVEPLTELVARATLEQRPIFRV